MPNPTPIPPTITAGQPVTTTEWAAIRDAMNLALYPPMALLRQAVAQSIPTATWTALLFDTEDFDRDNGHSTATNTSRYTCQTPGWYEVIAGYSAHAVASGSQRLISLWVNGGFANASSRGGSMETASYNLNDCTVQINHRLYLAAGDYLETKGYQDSAGALLTAGPGALNCFMHLYRLGA